MAQDCVFLTKKYWHFFLLLHENICCGYSLEVLCQGSSIEYPRFSWINKTNNLSGYSSYLELLCGYSLELYQRGHSN